jgi:hypothetical protein
MLSYSGISKFVGYGGADAKIHYVEVQRLTKRKRSVRIEENELK